MVPVWYAPTACQLALIPTWGTFFLKKDENVAAFDGSDVVVVVSKKKKSMPCCVCVHSSGCLCLGSSFLEVSRENASSDQWWDTFPPGGNGTKRNKSRQLQGLSRHLLRTCRTRW